MLQMACNIVEDIASSKYNTIMHICRVSHCRRSCVVHTKASPLMIEGCSSSSSNSVASTRASGVIRLLALYTQVNFDVSEVVAVTSSDDGSGISLERSISSDDGNFTSLEGECHESTCGQVGVMKLRSLKTWRKLVNEIW